MNQHACYHCNLLFEADGPVPCPQCGRPLQRYGQAPADERTHLVAPPSDLASIPDPEGRTGPRREAMQPVSRFDAPQHVDGGRRANYGEGRAEGRRYDGGRIAPQREAEAPQNRALPDARPGGGGRVRSRNTGSLRLGRSESPGPRSSWDTDRAARSTREVDLRQPSSPRAPRGRFSDAPASRPADGEGRDVAKRDHGQVDIPEAPRRRNAGTRDDIRLPRQAPGGGAEQMESTRMLSAIDLADGPRGEEPLERTRMVSAVVDASQSGGDDQMESTRMLSAIDLASAGRRIAEASDLDRTHALSPLDVGALGRGRAPVPEDDERTRMHGVIDLEQTLSADGSAPSPFPSPGPRGGGPSPFPDPTPRGGPSPFPDPTPRGGPSPFPDPSPRADAPSPFPDPSPRADAAPSPQPRSDLRRAAPQPLVPPGAPAIPSPVAPAVPSPVAAATPAPVAAPVIPSPAVPDPAGGARRTRALQVPAAPATPAPVAPATPAPVAPATPAPAAPAAPPPPAADPVPDYSDKYASYFDARGPAGAQLTDALGAIIGEQQQAVPMTAAGRVGPPRRRRTHPLVWIAPIVLFVGVIITIAALYEGPDDAAEADAGVADAPALAGVEQVVAELGLALPKARGAEVLPPDPPYIVAGAEALRVRGTPRILGVSSVSVPDNVVMQSPEGEWIQPLRDALGTTPRNQLDLLALALDEKVDARAVARFAQSAEKARFESVGLVVRRLEGAGGLGVLPINTGPTEAPSAGRVMIRVGRLAVTIRLETRDGEQDDPNAKIQNADAGLDLDAIEVRLAALSKAHPLVREAVVLTYPELPLRDLIHIFERARIGADKERFTRLRLVVN